MSNGDWAACCDVLRRDAHGRPPRAGRLSCSAEPGLSNWGISLSADVGGSSTRVWRARMVPPTVQTGRRVGYNPRPRHWTPEAPLTVRYAAHPSLLRA